MSDLDQLDRAFESFTRDLAHAPSPGAAAAVTTARKRRRTRVGAVALAALVVVGAGVAAPRLHLTGDGVAGGADGAPLDAAALQEATRGWMTGWEAWTRYSPKGGGGFSVPACFSTEDMRDKEPETGGGLSRFLGDDFGMAVAVFADYPDAATAARAQEAAYGACTGTTTIVVDGTEVRHFAVPPADADTTMTDIWTAQVGAQRVTFQVAGRAGVAPVDVAEQVAEAVVAGLRSGEAQETYASDPDAADPVQVPQLPEVMDRDLVDALAGWRAATPRRGSQAPNAPCLSVEVSYGALASSSSGSPRGVTWALGGFADEQAARRTADRMLQEVRGCPDLTVRTLANGTTLAIYEDDDGHGAVWIGAVGDRVGVVAVDAAAGPAPEGVDEAVAGVLDDWMRLAWR
ncbi:hypothetical protein NOCA1120102 [metagenome]|uniref:Uncharacterized protein n=1 Tax=metagenome TaxID=256318 RepID=A0A2P2C3K6_9ZZZZ